MDVIAPLYDRQSDSPQPLCGLVLQIDPDQFLYPMIEAWPVPSRTAETLLVRREGEFIVFLNNLRHIENAALRLKISLNRQDVPAVRAVLGTTGLFSGTDYRGEQVLSVLMPIPDSPWFMVTKMDSSEAFAEIRFNQWMILLLTIGLLVITFSGAGLLWQYMRKLHYKTVYQSEL
jgi:hypothetical protein